MAARNNICFMLNDRLGLETQFICWCHPAGDTDWAFLARSEELTAEFGAGFWEKERLLPFCLIVDLGLKLAVKGLMEPWRCSMVYTK